MTLRPVVDRVHCEARLKKIFPPDAFDTVLSNRLAASAVSAMIYVGAVVNDDGDPVPDFVWARPMTVIAMSDEAMGLTATSERRAWAGAESKAVKAIVALLDEWGIEHDPWYATNSRETRRDETWPKWRSYGAVRKREGLPASSPLPRWALTASFADLFNPQLLGPALHRDRELAPHAYVTGRTFQDPTCPHTRQVTA